MERGTLVAITVLASCQLPEVPRGLGDDLVVQPENDATGWLSVDGDVKLKQT